jgi:LPS-assembly protein
LALGCLLISTASPDAPAADWDCRVSADGQSWDCYQGGALVEPPPAPSATAPSPASETSAIPAHEPTPMESVSEPATETSIEIRPATEPATVVPEALPVVVDDAETEAAESTTSSAIGEPETLTPDTTAEPPGKATKPVTESQTSRPAHPAEAAIDKEQPPAEPSGEIGTVDQQPELQTPPAATTHISEPAQDWTESDTRQSRYCRTKPKQHTQRQPQENTITHIDADDAQVDDTSGIATFRGNVMLSKGDQQIQANEVIYNSNTADVNASGNLDFQRPDLAFQGESAQLNLNTDTGQANEVRYQLPVSEARGTAQLINLLGDGKSSYQDISYTTCEPGTDDWVFTAEDLEIDQNSGVGVAHDMHLYFKDVPILYLPYASFPIDDRRKSGFLIPSIGSSEINGADISAPYYFNLAPNYDATVTPRYMSERGLMLGGEFRYLDKNNNSIFIGELLPNDDLYTGRDNRGAASLVHNTSFSDRLSGSLNLNYVSDRQYLEDLGNSLAITSTQYLQRSAALNYNGDNYSITGRALQYQPVDIAITATDEPYRLLPQITFSGEQQIANTDFTADLMAQYTSFDHDVKVEGNRIDVKPSIKYEWLRSWGFLIPKLSVRYTSYDLSNQTPGLPDSIDRTTETFSLDSGLIFERDTSWFGQSAIQTLEPRAFYLYTPEEDQSDIPLFDTGLYSFSLASLFRENRFSGADRIGDANQLTLAVTTRFISKQTSREWLNATLGQILYFEDRSVQLSGTTPTSKDTSAYVAVLGSNPSPRWNAQAGIQWDPDLTDEIQKSSVRIKYEDPDRHLFSARYQQDKPANLEYVTASAYWPVAFNTRLVGHVNYSIEDDRYVETVAGIEHGSSCCWRLRALLRDYQVNAAAESNLTFMLQLELSGFARLGQDIDSYLEDTIEGFVRDE